MSPHSFAAVLLKVSTLPILCADHDLQARYLLTSHSPSNRQVPSCFLADGSAVLTAQAFVLL